jgi:hypothetical protein
VRVAEPGRGFGLAEEAALELAAQQQVGAGNLDGHRAAELGIGAQQDHAQAAAAELALDAEAADALRQRRGPGGPRRARFQVAHRGRARGVAAPHPIEQIETGLGRAQLVGQRAVVDGAFHLGQRTVAVERLVVGRQQRRQQVVVRVVVFGDHSRLPSASSRRWMARIQSFCTASVERPIWRPISANGSRCQVRSTSTRR